MKVSWSLRVSTTWPGTGLLGDVDWVVSGCGRRGFVGVNQVGTACVGASHSVRLLHPQLIPHPGWEAGARSLLERGSHTAGGLHACPTVSHTPYDTWSLLSRSSPTVWHRGPHIPLCPTKVASAESTGVSHSKFPLGPVGLVQSHCQCHVQDRFSLWVSLKFLGAQ